jgi:hypothetical protein
MKMSFGIIAAASIAASSTAAIAQTITPINVTTAPAGGIGAGFGLGGLGAASTLGIAAGLTVVVGGVLSSVSKSNSGSH